jgi:MFS family permease
LSILSVQGRKAATLFASFIFGLGCLLCGLSQTFTQLCLARAFAGIGGGGLTTMSTILTSDIVTLKARGTYQGLGNLVFAAGAALGAPLGGLLADGRLGWRFAFLIQVPFCALHFFAVSWKVDIPAGPGSVVEKMKRIDVFGALSLVSAVTLVLTGLSLGGNQRDWNDPIVYSALIAGGILLCVFVAVEKYVAREPLMPMTVLFRRTPGFVAIACWFISMSQFGIIFNVPLYFQAVEETSSSYAGLHLIPNAIVASACSLGSGLLIARWGRYKNMLLIGGFSAFVGPFAMCFWQRGVTPSFGYWLTMPWGGAGYGSILTITLVALIASVSPTEMAAATGVTYLFRATGSVLGISLSGALLQNRLQHNLEIVGLSPKTIAAIRQDVSYIKSLKGDIKEEAIAAMQSSFRTVFIAIAAAGLIAFLALWPVPEHDLPGKTKVVAPRREEAIAEEEEP